MNTSVSYGFLFVKPGAGTDDVHKVVKERLESAKISILEQGTYTGEQIKEGGMIDAHYLSISEKANTSTPNSLNIDSSVFTSTFKDDFEEVKSQNRLVTLSQYEKVAGEGYPTGDEVATTMENGIAANGAPSVFKVGGGFYLRRIAGPTESDPVYYVVNAFYRVMKAAFEEYPGVAVEWYTLKWNVEDLSWEDFRGKVIGATNPAIADPSSIRGTIFANKDAFKFEQVNSGFNCVHGSASPLEAAFEIANWTKAPRAKLPFIESLMELGATEELLDSWVENCEVTPSSSGKSTPIFDLVEDMNPEDVLNTLKEFIPKVESKSEL